MAFRIMLLYHTQARLSIYEEDMGSELHVFRGSSGSKGTLS